MSVTVRLATDADRPLVVRTLAEYHPHLDPSLRYAWLYLGNPHGRALTWLAFDDASGELAGLTSFFPRRLWVRGREERGALGGDGYVRPAFRRRGIGGRMHGASRRDMEAAGIRVMFGTPMPANKTPLDRAGARDVGTTVRYARPLPGALAPHAPVLRRLPSVAHRALGALVGPFTQLDPVVPHDPRVDAVWADARRELGIATVRDAAFYTWRFLESPSRVQRPYVILRGGAPIGVCALERHDGRLRVVDLVAPRKSYRAALSAIVRHAHDVHGGELLAAVDLKLVREQAATHKLWASGFLPRDTKPLNLLWAETEREPAVWSDPSAWYFTWADSDMDHG